MYLYCVENGAVNRLLFTREDLSTLPDLRVSGYVWGIVAFCDPDVTASAQGKALTRVAANDANAYPIKYFGAIPSHGLSAATGLDEKDASKLNAYSLFPMVQGDALIYADEFTLSFQEGTERFAIPVRQNGCRQFCSFFPEDVNRQLKFNYLGGAPEDMRVRPDDLQESLRAVEKGVHDVESLFRMNLIDKVNVLEFNQAYGGVTADDSDRSMWLYNRVFENESPLELMHMASHETLHQYVMAMGWTRYTPVRELFSDLKGYDAFSRERFLLVTQGVAPKAPAESPDKDLFFAVIDERNFLEGARGGHSQLDLDEFCASFFHSLMYVDRLENVLAKKIHLTPGKNDRGKILTRAEKSRILDRYARTIQCFLDALNEARPSDGALRADPTRQALEHGLKVVRSIQADSENRLARKSDQT